jgi:hypothetical protein
MARQEQQKVKFIQMVLQEHKITGKTKLLR